jgi:hypothetical protein
MGGPTTWELAQAHRGCKKILVNDVVNIQIG